MVSFVLDKGMAGLTQSKPLRKMGLHGSPTGELFLDDVRVGRDRLLGETEEAPARSAAKDTFASERTGVAAMALGIVEQCLEALGRVRAHPRPVRPPHRRVPADPAQAREDGGRPDEHPEPGLPPDRLAAEGKPMGLAEASACKLYAAQATMEVTLEAVQLFGGNGYMAEYQVEQLCRDAKVLQIYGGTDEIQVSQIAKDLLNR